jgi:cytochrome c oxidase cbb3-type subunit I/II
MNFSHSMIEKNSALMIVLIILVVAVGGLVEIVPLYFQKSTTEPVAGLKPYTPVQLAGRDIYLREGCYNCHSQMIRPFRSETERYGEYSKAGEFVYDHPFLWGSERKGPDLAREGGKYPDAWHFNHMDDPRSTSPGTIMPRYSWLLTQKMETDTLPARLNALRKIGVPYPAGFENGPAQKELQAQADKVVANLKLGSVKADPDKEIIALIAYLQRLGTDIKSAPVTTAAK